MNLTNEFTQMYHRPPMIQGRAPARVNLLGEHVDYNGGPVLPAAIDRAVYIAAAPNQSDTINVKALDLKSQASFRIDQVESKQDLDGRPLPPWARYPAGVVWALREAGLRVPGIDAVYASDVPIGAGLSSSAAVEVAFAVAFQTLGDRQTDRMKLAQLCQRAENQYVGVNCGLMDQFASSHGVEGHALYFDTRSLAWEPVPLPAGTSLVVADSGVRRSLTNSAYNDRRAACETAISILQHEHADIQSLRDVTPEMFEVYKSKLPAKIEQRARHVVEEIARVERAVNALWKGEGAIFGELMFAGHASLRDLYEVSTAELDALVEIAQESPGRIGARLTGAGFGGCTINLVKENKAEAFIDCLKKGYQTRTGRTAQIYLCKASGGASTEIVSV